MLIDAISAVSWNIGNVITVMVVTEIGTFSLSLYMLLPVTPGIGLFLIVIYRNSSKCGMFEIVLRK